MLRKDIKLLILTMLNCLLFMLGYGQEIMVKLPDTNQQIKYTTLWGEDADYSINPPSYTENGDGTIKDNVTGLIWQKEDGGEMTWELATEYCKSLSLAELDWRLPNPYELFGILDHSVVNPAINVTYFTKTKAEYWWANANRADDNSKVWATNAGGGIGPHPKNETISEGGIKKFHVRCVKDDTWTSELTDNLDGTISDSKTGLMWEKDAGTDTKTWEEALDYAEALSFAGHDDWRLPNVKELQSLVDIAFVNPSINTLFFTNTQQLPYWTSTTLVNENSRAWMTDFKYGIVSYSDKSEALNYRCVRGGSSVISIIKEVRENLFFSTRIDQNAKLIIHIQNSNEKEVLFQLYNINGELIRNFSSNKINAAVKVISINISQLESGIYILSGKNKKQYHSEKIVINR